MNTLDCDQRLVVAINAGVNNALAELYDRHAPRLMRLVYNILKNHSDAEDLLHDIFLEVWNKADTYNPERGSVLSWLIVRARSRALDRKRSLDTQRNHQIVDNTDHQQISPTNSDHSINELTIKKALAQLPQSQRATVQLSYFHGLTYEEIAQRDNIPIGTVKSRLSAAIRKLSLYFAAARGVTP